jgi:hypothetical protein
MKNLKERKWRTKDLSIAFIILLLLTSCHGNNENIPYVGNVKFGMTREEVESAMSEINNIRKVYEDFYINDSIGMNMSFYYCGSSHIKTLEGMAFSEEADVENSDYDFRKISLSNSKRAFSVPDSLWCLHTHKMAFKGDQILTLVCKSNVLFER